MDIHLVARNLKKAFNRRVIFQDVSFTAGVQQILLIAGRNGSGKSTLVKILADVLSPTEGTVDLEPRARAMFGARSNMVGFVAPYMMLYDEFTARENLQMALTIRAMRPDKSYINELLSRVGMANRMDDQVRTFSSGMKQRVKYAFALVHHPPILLLDEPMSNLDEEGIGMVRDIMDEHRQMGILVVATNDLTDIHHHDIRVDLNAAH